MMIGTIFQGQESFSGRDNIRIGPTLPAFITPNVLNVLVEKYNIMPIKTPEEDLKAILA